MLDLLKALEEAEITEEIEVPKTRSNSSHPWRRERLSTPEQIEARAQRIINGKKGGVSDDKTLRPLSKAALKKQLLHLGQEFPAFYKCKQCGVSGNNVFKFYAPIAAGKETWCYCCGAVDKGVEQTRRSIYRSDADGNLIQIK